MECNICIEIKNDTEMYHCTSCNYHNCIQCHKIYLLTSTQDPHCINCRITIPYDFFLQKFNRNWVFSKYKKHRQTILLDREKSLFPLTVARLGKKKEISILQKEKEELMKRINEIDSKIYYINNPDKKNTKITFQYMYSCPLETCKGYLNEKFICDLCDANICKNCYTEMNKKYLESHKCNDDLVETFKAIKKEAKPCPSCGEFISKVSGCDQMFCTTCGTAFSWKTGQIEKGIIHNPHASLFFQNNQQALQNYQNQLQNNNAYTNGVCRPLIPPLHEFNVQFMGEFHHKMITKIHRRISEFRQYRRINYISELDDNNDKNYDVRVRYINNEIDDKRFKEIIHARDKKVFFRKQIIRLILFMYEISETFLWEIAMSIPSKNIMMKITDEITNEITNEINIKYKNNIDLLFHLRDDTNNNIKYLTDEFKYTVHPYIDESFYCPYF